MAYLLLASLTLFFSPAISMASEVMFEGFYRIELNGKHIGYVVQRNSFEPKTKSFQVAYLIRHQIGETVTQESLKANSNDKFEPLNYQYTVQEGTKLKAIDGSFKGEIMDLKIVQGKEVRTEKHKIPKGTFLSSFLPFMMLQRKLELNKPVTYSAVTEEQPGSANGKAMVSSKTSEGRYDVYRILNRFNGEDFIANIAAVKDPTHPDKNMRGEVISTEAPKKGLVIKLVAVPSQATEGQTVPNKVLTSLFGNMPSGKINLLSEGQAQKDSTPPAQEN